MSVDIKEIVSKQGIDSVKQTTIELEKSVLVLQDFIVGAKAMNDVLAKSGSMGQLTKNVQAQEIAQEKLKQSILKTQALEVKLENDRQAAFAKEQARKAKSLADEQKAIAADEKRIAVLQRKANASFQATGSGETQGSNTGTTVNSGNIDAANAANSASAINTNTQATQKNTASKRNQAIATEEAKQAQARENAQLKANVKELNTASGSIDAMRLRLNRLQKQYDALSATQRNGAFGQKLQADIIKTNAEVLALEKTTGRAQRNVGNYGNAFSKAFGGIRTLANILPGIGISGIFLIAYQGLEKLAEGLNLFSKSADNAKLRQNSLEKAISSSSYSDAVKNINELRINIDLAKRGLINKDEVLKQYNETIGKTTGQVKTLDQAEQDLSKNADDFIKATLYKAAAQIALEEAAKKAYEAEITRRKRLEEFSNVAVDQRVSSGGASGFGTGQFDAKEYEKETERINKARIKRQDQQVKILKDEEKKQLDIARDFQENAALFSLNFKSFFGNDEKEKKAKKGVDPAIQARKNAAALIQVQIDLTKEQQEIYKQQQDNEGFSLESRLLSQERFQERSIKLVELEAEKSKAEKKNTSEELLAIESKRQLEEAKIIQDGFAKRTKIIAFSLEEEEKIRLYQEQRTLTLLEKQRDEELTKLINSYQKTGNYSEKAQEQIEIKRLEIVRKYALIEVNEQIKQAQRLIEVRKLTGADVVKEEANLSALILKAKELELKEIDDFNKKRLDKEKQNAEKIKEVAQELFDFSRSLTAGIFEANIANLEEEGRIRDERKTTDIENVNESILSEEEKANRIAVINAQAEQAQIAIDAKISEQKRKQAIADKAFALSQIAINTAIAVSKALAQTGVLGAFVIPGIIALGAIQAATVLAQPIPKFAKGGVMGKDGLAEYGHGVETRIDPDGRVSLTDATPEIGFVKKGTRFISASETKQMLAKPDKYDVGGKSWDISGLIAESRNNTKEMKKAVKSLKVPSTIITKGGWSEQQSRVSKMNSYIKSNFGR